MKKRILFYIQVPPPIHGTSIVNEVVANNTSIREGFDVTVIKTIYNKTISSVGVLSFHKLLMYLKFTYLLIKKLITLSPEIVYLSVVPSGKIFYRDALTILLIKLFRKKIVLHIHGIGISKATENSISRFFYTIIYKNCFAITTSNALIKDLNFIQNAINKIYVVYNGISPLKEIVVPKNKDIINFFYLSSIMGLKGQLVLLKAINNLKQRGFNNFKCTITGQIVDQNYYNELTQYVHVNHLQDHISLGKGVYGSDKEFNFSKSDVFIFPSYADAFGLVALEAMSLGKPVIASDMGSIREIITEKTGYIFKPGDDNELSYLMERFIKDKNLADKMRDSVLKQFNNNFTLERFNENMYKAFLDISSF